MATTPAKVTRLRDPTREELLPLEQQPRYAAERKKLDGILQRIETAERRRQISMARNRGQQPTRSFAERAAALLAGGSVQLPAPEGELAAAQEELRILHAARMAKCEELEALKSELSYEVCKRFAEQNAEGLRAAHEAATALHAALEVCRTIRGLVVGAGYSLNTTAMPTHTFGEAAALGDPRLLSSSAAGRFFLWLKEAKIL